MNSITVVTVTHNSSFVLDSYLETLVEGASHNDEIIVVDSGSDDIELTRAIAQKHAVRLIESNENVGYGAGTNLGANAAANKWLAIVNPDVIVSLESLHRLVDEASVADIQCLGPSITTLDGTPVQTVRQSIRPLWRPRGNPPLAAAGLTITESISGCCMVIQRDHFLAIGGFDRYFFMFCEEIDLHKRIREGGGRVGCTTSVTVQTPGGASSSTTSERWNATERAVAHIRYVRKHFSVVEAAIDLLFRSMLIMRGGVYKPRWESVQHLWNGVFDRKRRLRT